MPTIVPFGASGVHGPFAASLVEPEVGNKTGNAFYRMDRQLQDCSVPENPSTWKNATKTNARVFYY